MNEPIIEGNCGELCNYHCCRSQDDNESLGMYLLPEEFEAVQEHLDVSYEVHSSYAYDLPMGTKKLYYIFCSNDSGCLRNHRPIQCRTYPLEPHMVDGKLTLIIEKNQFHGCPLIDQTELWRQEFLEGIYKGWEVLLTIDSIKKYVEELSLTRESEQNILKSFNKNDIFNLC